MTVTSDVFRPAPARSFVPDYALLETAFTVMQFAVAGPLIALAYRR